MGGRGKEGEMREGERGGEGEKRSNFYCFGYDSWSHKLEAHEAMKNACDPNSKIFM